MNNHHHYLSVTSSRPSKTAHVRRRASFWIEVSLAAAALAALADCYNPKVESGTIRCATSGKQCPGDFKCEGGVCVDPTLGSGGRGGQGGTSASGGAGGTCATPVASLCSGPSTVTGGCDPICQVGCGCGLRCTQAKTGAGACAPLTGQKKVGEICAPSDDQCGSGLVCLGERCGTNVGRCYRFCDEGTCDAGGVCGTPIDLPGGVQSQFKVCNVANQVCDPFARTGCPNPALVCYQTSSGTKCDCPNDVQQGEGQPCTFYNDCMPGMICLTVNSGGGARCHKLCKANTDCTANGACTPIGGGESYSFCP